MRDPTSDAAETRLNRLLNLILETAVDVLGYDAATITARHETGLSTIGATDQRLVDLDVAQYESGEGPCLDVLDPHEPLYVEDVLAEERWEHFRRTAEELGVHSSLSLHIPTDSEGVAASLNLYAKRAVDLGDNQLRAAQGFAEQLAAAIISVDAYRATATLAADLAEAMRTRAVIEQAKGMLMARDRITADEAFTMLVEQSQNQNRKLRDIAQELVDEQTRRD